MRAGLDGLIALHVALTENHPHEIRSESMRPRARWTPRPA
ncbi:MAG: hypothetical protein RLZZ140_775, partial [Pseudomonadota bacterium]